MGTKGSRVSMNVSAAGIVLRAIPCLKTSGIRYIHPRVAVQVAKGSDDSEMLHQVPSGIVRSEIPLTR